MHTDVLTIPWREIYQICYKSTENKERILGGLKKEAFLLVRVKYA